GDIRAARRPRGQAPGARSDRAARRVSVAGQRARARACDRARHRAVVVGDAAARRLPAPSARGARPRAAPARGRHGPGGRETLVRQQGAGGIRRQQGARRRAPRDRPAHALSHPRASSDRGRRMRLGLALGGLLLAAAGCASPARAPERPADRTELIRAILASTVQLRSEHEAGVSRAASGVVLATHLPSRRTWIATARHFLEPRPQQLYVRLPGQTTMAPATIAFVSGDRDLAIIETEDAGVTP